MILAARSQTFSTDKIKLLILSITITKANARFLLINIYKSLRNYNSTAIN